MKTAILVSEIWNRTQGKEAIPSLCGNAVGVREEGKTIPVMVKDGNRWVLVENPNLVILQGVPVVFSWPGNS